MGPFADEKVWSATSRASPGLEKVGRTRLSRLDGRRPFPYLVLAAAGLSLRRPKAGRRRSRPTSFGLEALRFGSRNLLGPEPATLGARLNFERIGRPYSTCPWPDLSKTLTASSRKASYRLGRLGA